MIGAVFIVVQRKLLALLVPASCMALVPVVRSDVRGERYADSARGESAVPP